MKKILLSCSCQSEERSFYGKGKKSDIPDENLLSSTNKMSKKVMVSATILWYGVTKTFFVNNNDIKVNKANYYQQLRNTTKCDFIVLS